MSEDTAHKWCIQKKCLLIRATRELIYHANLNVSHEQMHSDIAVYVQYMPWQ